MGGTDEETGKKGARASGDFWYYLTVRPPLWLCLPAWSASGRALRGLSAKDGGGLVWAAKTDATGRVPQVGLDAEVAYRFHSLREKRPWLSPTRRFNIFWCDPRLYSPFLLGSPPLVPTWRRLAAPIPKSK